MEDKNGPAFTNRVDHPEKDAVKLFGGVVILAVLAIIVGLITKDGRNFLLGLVNPNDTVGVTFNINTENPQSVSKNLYGSSSAQYFDLFDWGGDTDM